MYLDIFSSIIETIGAWTEAIGLGWLVVIGLSLVLLTIIISFICTQFSIEIKTLRAINRLNKYLELNPFVTEDNLVEFNKLMKRIPSTMRREWQQFMVSRDKKPSEFFTDQNCIERPFKASSYQSHIVAVKTSVICIAIISFIFASAYFASGTSNTQFNFLNIISSLTLSGLSLLVGEIYLLFLKARRNSVISDVYYNFSSLQKYLDRATSTLPEYIDYEILFTRKEITAGIPVLQEYLQQRALFEQEQIKKAKESQVVHENYDFSSLGINGSLVMEKAMRVSEQFIGNKNGTRAYIEELEGQKELLEKNYDEKAKQAQRKLRDIQETLDRLKEKLDATTNLIVGNDLRKQRENEIQKQRQIEKESLEDSRKFEEERKKIDEQIEAKRAEIEEDRKRAETSLNSEFKSYADKIYAELKAVVDEQNKEHIDELNAESVKLQQELEERDRIIVEKNALYDEKCELVEEYEKKFNEQDALIVEQSEKISEADSIDNLRNKELFDVKKELESRKIEIVKKDELIENQKAYIQSLKAKKHINGDEIYADEDGRLFFIDESGNKKYVNNGEQQLAEESNQVIEEVVPQEDAEVADEQVEQQEKNESQFVGPIDFEDNEIDSGLAQQVEEQLGVPEEEPQVEGDLEELKAQFHKPIYDFQWENSNSQSAASEEEQKEKQEELAKEKKELNKKLKPVKEKDKKKEPKIEEQQEEAVDENQGNKKAEEQSAEQEDIGEKSLEEEKEDVIEELDKLIEEQNAKLEEQNQSLSKQLEDTQKVAKEEPKPKSKKSSAKKPSKKKPVAKKKLAEKKPASKKPTKPKKQSTKKPASKKASIKKQPEKQKEVSAETPIVDLNLAQFNEQLKNMLKDIDNDGDKE